MIRLSVDLPDEVAAKLRGTGTAPATNAVIRAIILLDHFEKVRAMGGRVLVEDRDGHISELTLGTP